MRNWLLLILVFLIGCSYNVLEDKLDCSKSNLEMTFVIEDSDCSVDNGKVTINVTGGTLPITYNLNKIIQNEPVFTNLSSGNYTVVITDKNGCVLEDEVVVINKNGFVAVVSSIPSGCKSSNGGLIVNPSNGVEPYMYQIEGGTTQSSNQFNGLPTGDHIVLVMDALECTFEVSAFIPTGVSYSQDLSPIISNSCAVTGCHNGTNSLPDFRSLSNVQSFASQVKSRTQSGNMPQVGTLTQEEKDLIACWVDDGALDN